MQTHSCHLVAFIDRPQPSAAAQGDLDQRSLSYHLFPIYNTVSLTALSQFRQPQPASMCHRVQQMPQCTWGHAGTSFHVHHVGRSPPLLTSDGSWPVKAPTIVLGLAPRTVAFA